MKRKCYVIALLFFSTSSIQTMLKMSRLLRGPYLEIMKGMVVQRALMHGFERNNVTHVSDDSGLSIDIKGHDHGYHFWLQQVATADSDNPFVKQVMMHLLKAIRSHDEDLIMHKITAHDPKGAEKYVVQRTTTTTQHSSESKERLRILFQESMGVRLLQACSTDDHICLEPDKVLFCIFKDAAKKNGAQKDFKLADVHFFAYDAFVDRCMLLQNN